MEGRHRELCAEGRASSPCEGARQRSLAARSADKDREDAGNIHPTIRVNLHVALVEREPCNSAGARGKLRQPVKASQKTRWLICCRWKAHVQLGNFNPRNATGIRDSRCDAQDCRSSVWILVRTHLCHLPLRAVDHDQITVREGGVGETVTEWKEDFILRHVVPSDEQALSIPAITNAASAPTRLDRRRLILRVMQWRLGGRVDVAEDCICKRSAPML